SRTVGWFTSMYPVGLECAPGLSDGDLIKGTKEGLRGIPDKGLGYGVLRYLSGDRELAGQSDPWQVVFNYLGQVDNQLEGSGWFGASDEYSGATAGEGHLMSELMAINGIVSSGELALYWGYSERHFDRGTVEALAERYIGELDRLVDHCLSVAEATGGVHTPSDFGLGAHATYRELDTFFGEHPGAESVYRLSGLQEGMLFHSLYDRGVRAYIEQFSSEVHGIRPDLLAKSWDQLMARHSILRSAFYHDVFGVPVQAVYREVSMPVEELDLRDLDEGSQGRAIAAYEEEDLARGFDLASPPLMRLALMRLGEDRYHMVWTSHHMLFDGWSVPLLIGGLQEIYESLLSGGGLPVVGEDRFLDYISYIGGRDAHEEAGYWRSYMEGVESPVLLPFIAPTNDFNKGIGEYSSESLDFDEGFTSRLRAYAKENQLTVNTIMQGVWSYLLYRYTGQGDVVFGITVSGRPEELPDVERRVGMYINTLPLHARVEEGMPVAEWLRGLQSEQVSSRHYQYSRLSDIQRWSGLQGDIFDSLLVFENYPVSDEIFSEDWSLHFGDSQMKEQTNYPLSLTMASGERSWILFTYNSRLLGKEHIELIKGHFGKVLGEVVDGPPGQRIGDLGLLTPPERTLLLEGFRGEEASYPTGVTVVDLFRSRAQESPDR
ncbi:MAG: condensation domain-containing protein, partial [Roseitalea porphyridii]